MRTLRIWLEVHTASATHRMRRDFAKKVQLPLFGFEDKRKKTKEVTQLPQSRFKEKRKENKFSSFPFFFPTFRTKNQTGQELTAFLFPFLGYKDNLNMKGTKGLEQNRSIHPQNAHLPKPVTQSNK